MALEFQINLGGNFVEALDKGNKALGDTEKDTQKAAHALELFEGELGKVKAGALGLNFNAFQEGGHFLTFDLAEGAALAFEAIKKIGEAVYDLGKEMIVAAGAAEDLNLAIKLDVGEEGAEKVNSLAESFKGSRFSPKQIKESLLPLLEDSGNKNAEMWDDLTTAATDVATRRNTGAAGAKAALESLNDISLNPQRLRGSLKALGIHQVDFYKDLGNLLGISEKTAEAQTKAGKIQSKTLLSVALNQIATREGGELGNATNEGEKTLGASLARLGNLKENLFERLAGSRGLQAVKGFLDNFITTMEGPIGTDLVNKIGGAFETLFGDLSGPDGLAKMGDAISGIATKVGTFISDFQDAWPKIKEGVSTIWDVMKGIGDVVATIARGWHEIFDLMHQAGYIKDLVTGNAQVGLANDTVNENSPAWKRNGQHGPGAPDNVLAGPVAAQAAALGLPAFASGGMVDRPTLALVGEAGPEAIVPLGASRRALDVGGAASGGGDMHFMFEMNIQTGARDAHELARDLEPEMRVMFKRLIVEAGAAFGVAA